MKSGLNEGTDLTFGEPITVYRDGTAIFPLEFIM